MGQRRILHWPTTSSLSMNACQSNDVSTIDENVERSTSSARVWEGIDLWRFPINAGSVIFENQILLYLNGYRRAAS